MKKELNQYSIEEIELLFNEVLAAKRKEDQERKLFKRSLQRLCDILNRLCMLAEQKRKVLLLFESIGCKTDNFTFSADAIINGVTVGELIGKPTSRDKEQRMQSAGVSNPVFAKEMKRYYDKLGFKVTLPQYTKLIRNSLIARDVITEEISEKDIRNYTLHMF